MINNAIYIVYVVCDHICIKKHKEKLFFYLYVATYYEYVFICHSQVYHKGK